MPAFIAISDKRRQRRLKAFVVANLDRDGILSRVHLLDISADGVRAHIAIAPGTHQQVTLVWGDTHISGKVIWTEGKRFGMVFDAPISQDLLERMLMT